jgi:predicted nucleic acid-binding protein
VFINTSVFVASVNRSDKNHKGGKALIERALKGEHGVAYTSDYVIDKSITTALARTHNFDAALKIGSLKVETMRIEKIFTGPEEFQASWRKFQKFDKKPLSFTDCVSLTLMEIHGIDKIISFDSAFDGLITRIQ